MEIPTVINFDESRIPYEGSTTFRQDASYVWSTIPAVIKSMNATISEMNISVSATNQAREQTAIDASFVRAAKDEAISAKDEAVLAKNEIEGYVIPTEATYSPQTIQAKIAMDAILTTTGAM